MYAYIYTKLHETGEQKIIQKHKWFLKLALPNYRKWETTIESVLEAFTLWLWSLNQKSKLRAHTTYHFTLKCNMRMMEYFSTYYMVHSILSV